MTTRTKEFRPSAVRLVSSAGAFLLALGSFALSLARNLDASVLVVLSAGVCALGITTWRLSRARINLDDERIRWTTPWGGRRTIAVADVASKFDATNVERFGAPRTRTLVLLNGAGRRVLWISNRSWDAATLDAVSARVPVAAVELNTDFDPGLLWRIPKQQPTWFERHPVLAVCGIIAVIVTGTVVVRVLHG
jgi:hypothetical protein